jgi:hypothetical protein
MAGSLNMGMDPELDPNDTKALRGQSDVNGNISEEDQGGISACGKHKLVGFWQGKIADGRFQAIMCPLHITTSMRQAEGCRHGLLFQCGTRHH